MERAGAPSPSRAELIERTHQLAGRLREQRRRLSIRERDQAIAELHAAGLSVRQIARAAGLSRTQVYRVLERELGRRGGGGPNQAA